MTTICRLIEVTVPNFALFIDLYPDSVQQKIARRSYGEEDTGSDEMSSPSSQMKVSHKYHSLLSGKRVIMIISVSILMNPQIASTDVSINEDGMDAITEEAKAKVYTKSQWLKILKNNDLDNTSATELVHSLRHGIPDELYLFSRILTGA